MELNLTIIILVVVCLWVFRAVISKFLQVFNTVSGEVTASGGSKTLARCLEQNIESSKRIDAAKKKGALTGDQMLEKYFS